jgi:acetyltransferase-like isoleucine patch superfamily enzyme
VLRRLLDSVAQRLGRTGYHLDRGLTEWDLINVLLMRTGQVVRGVWWRLWFGSVRGVLLVGRDCRLRFCRHISAGRTLSLGDGVTINGLCRTGIRFGDNVTLRAGVVIDGTGVLGDLGEGLTVGSNVGISEGSFLQVRGTVTIGDDVIIGPGVKIFSENHRTDDSDLVIRLQGVTRRGVTIERGVWLGAGATILDGVTIGEQAIVAAGSVVTRSVPPAMVVAGVPARIIRARKDMNQRADDQ